MDAEHYDEFLQPLPDDRRSAVKAWLGSALSDCGTCGQPVRVMDSHRTTKVGIVHTTCIPTDS